VVSRHQNTQQYGAILPIELTTEDIKNTKAYKEYYACTTGEAAPKPKASARKKKGGSTSSTTPLTPIATPTPTTTVVAAPRLSAAAKEAEQLKIVLRRSRHEKHISQQGGSSTDEGIGSIPGVPDVPSDDSKEEISWNSSDDEDVDYHTKGSDDKEGEKTDESNDDDDQDEAEKVNDDDDDEEEISKIDEQEATESGEGDDEEAENDKDDGNGEEDQGLRISEEERMHEEEEADELYRDVDINQGRGLQVSQDIKDSHVTITPTHYDGQQESSSTSSFVTNLLNPIIDPGMESIFTTGSSTVTPIPSPKSTMTPSIMTTTTTASQPSIPSTPIPCIDLQNLLTFASVFRFEDKVKSLEVNFSEFMRTNQSTEAISNIPGLVHQYIHQEMLEVVREAVQIKTDRLQDSPQRENDEFLRTIDDNMKKIIKEQVKNQVKAQVTRILPRIEESVNTELKAEVLTRSSHSSRTSYAVATDLSEIELKKILIDKMEGNKSIQRSDEQRNLYKALVEAYDADKTILDTYGESAILKRRREEDNDQEGPSTGSDRASKRRREGGEHASANTPSEPATRSAGRRPPTPDRDWNKTLPAAQGNAQSWISTLAKQTNPRSSFNELLDTPIDFSNFTMNRLGVDTLTPKLLAGPTYELMRGSCKSLTELEYHLEEVYKPTTDQLDWDNPEGQQYQHNLLQPLPLIPDIRGDFKRLRLQDIEDMLLLLVQGKLSNLPVEECFAFNVSLRMFTRSIVIQRRVEDLQLGVESYQKSLNLTKPDKYRSDLKRRETYTAYSNPRGFIYQNRDKKNRLMQIDELHKFSDGMLNDVRNALDDRLKGIRM
nr:hypothetical protein [Tanacetum cinerariifolium]